MCKNTFYYEDGLENVFNENGEKVVEPMEGILTDIIDRMIEGPVKRGRKAAVARELGVKYTTAKRRWEHYQETGEVPYKKSEKNIERPRTLTEEHEEHIQKIVEKDPQFCAVDIIDSLTCLSLKTSQFPNLK